MVSSDKNFHAQSRQLESIGAIRARGPLRCAHISPFVTVNALIVRGEEVFVRRLNREES